MQCTPITTVTDKLADDVATLKRDNDVLKQRLDDLNSHEANQIGMLANQTSYLGTLIGIVSVGISLIAIVVGLFVRRRTDEVVKEFEDKKGDLLRVAELEIDKAKATNAQQLQAMADVLKADFATEKALLIQQIKNELQTLQQTFEQHEESYRSQVQDKLDTFDRYLRGKRDQIANDVLASGIEATPAQQQELAVLSSSSHKPAAQMTAEDYYNVALAAYSHKDNDAALAAINSGLNEKLAHTRDDVLTAKLMFIKALCQSDLVAEIECYQAIEDRFATSSEQAVRRLVAQAMINLSVTYTQNNQVEQAINTYQETIQRYGDDDNLSLREQVAKAMFNLGFTYNKNKQVDQSIDAYQTLIRLYGDDNSHQQQNQVVKAMIMLGIIYSQNNQIDKAISTYQKIIQIYGNDHNPLLREQVAQTILILGMTYGEKNQPEQAIKNYTTLIQRYSDDDSPVLREQVANAINHLGVVYSQNNQIDKAIKSYKTLIQRYSDDNSPELREQVAKAMNQLGIVYGQNNQIDQEVSTYKNLIKIYSDDESPVMREEVSRGLNSLGFSFLIQAKKALTVDRWAVLKKSLKPLLQALDRQPETELKSMVLGNLGYAHFLLGQPDEAERYTRECLQLGEDKVYQAQQKDAQQHRLEPEDSEYEAMLHRVWQEVSAAKA